MCAQATLGTDQSQPGWNNGSLFQNWVYSGVVMAGCGGCWSEGGRCVLGMGAVFQEGQPAVWRYSREQGWAGFNSVSWGREGVTGSVKGNMLEPKHNLFSSAGLTGPKVWGHQHSQNRLLCQHLLQTLCNFYHFLQALQFPTCSGCHSIVGSSVCLHPTRVRMGMW